MQITKTIEVNNLARVEGEGALTVHVRDGVVENVALRIFEPPRFFEAFLRGRTFAEAPDITARICGICPVAYQMSSVHAIEDAFDVEIEPAVRMLRRLLYCGEWIESHVLHVALLHAPDFLGYDDAIRMAGDYPEIVERALKLKKAGNDIVNLLGGREIHPINVCVGGFYRVPRKSAWNDIIETLKWAQEEALRLVAWTAELPFPDFERDYEFVALRHPDEYPFNEGRLVSNRGLDIAIADFEEVFEETHVAHSTALHGSIRERGPYFVGPLARFSLNFDKLAPLAQQAAKEAGLSEVCRNPFQSIIVRSVETLQAVNEALAILEAYPEPDRPAAEVRPKAGRGYGCSEAPRGILYHRYDVDDAGLITSARIVPPTAQNQPTIEDDLRHYVPPRMALPLNELTWQCEQAIRNYDPCISCSTHYLQLQIEER
jgi:coenzyme F420-reducing hydrogenase alpha subunit